jgi:hypothetical protein
MPWRSGSSLRAKPVSGRARATGACRRPEYSQVHAGQRAANRSGFYRRWCRGPLRENLRGGAGAHGSVWGGGCGD